MLERGKDRCSLVKRHVSILRQEGWVGKGTPTTSQVEYPNVEKAEREKQMLRPSLDDAMPAGYL